MHFDIFHIINSSAANFLTNLFSHCNIYFSRKGPYEAPSFSKLLILQFLLYITFINTPKSYLSTLNSTWTQSNVCQWGTLKSVREGVQSAHVWGLLRRRRWRWQWKSLYLHATNVSKSDYWHSKLCRFLWCSRLALR